MRAVWRVAIAVAAAGIALAPAGTLAQSAPSEASEAPAAETIGPRELQNFNLQGTVTREAEQANPPASAPAPSRAAPPPAETRTAAPVAAPRPTAEAPARASAAASPPPVRESAATRAQAAVPSASSLTVQLPPARSSAAAPIAAAATTADFPTEPDGENGLALWPWLLAAVALGAGGAFLFWRRGHHREAFAGGPQVDAFVVPEPPQPRRRRAPAPAPAPAKEPGPRPAGPGLVSASLRPWVDVEFQPLRCIIEDTRIRFEFAFDLVNSGGAPAREVLIEAKIINASADQDRDLAAFFGNPTGKGDRIKSIAPLERMSLRPQIILPREQVRVLDAGGRKLFVPLIAFTALYRWGGGEGQTSAAYLLGRDTKGEKMAPLRLDFGPRVFRSLAAKALPIAVRK